MAATGGPTTMTRKSHSIADRMKMLDASGIRKVFDLAAKLKDPINLSIGQPDFDVPESAKEAAIAAIRAGMNKYTQTQGTEELRALLRERCRCEFGWKDDRPYLVTSGVSGALMLAILTTVNPLDEVVFADPYFVMYSHLVNLAGGVPVPVSTYDDFRPDVQKLADAITDRTRMLIINSPSNPTGAVYTEQELRDIADVAARRDLLVVSDEIYNLFCYDQPFVSMAGLYENTILMRGFSKSYAMTGWRLGWCTGPRGDHREDDHAPAIQLRLRPEHGPGRCQRCPQDRHVRRGGCLQEKARHGLRRPGSCDGFGQARRGLLRLLPGHGRQRQRVRCQGHRQ